MTLAEVLIDYLRRTGRVGRAHPIKQAVAARELRCTTRDLQQAIDELPDDVLVASSCAVPMGIFLCATADDAAAYLEQLDHRIRGVAKRRKKVRAWIRRRRDREARTRRPPREPAGQLLLPMGGAHGPAGV